jgi:hypothetical protein
MLTVEDLSADLKEGSSGNHSSATKEIVEPFAISDVINMMENGSLLALFSTTNESVGVDDDTSNSSPLLGKSTLLTA